MKIHDALILMNGVFIAPVFYNVYCWKKCGIVFTVLKAVVLYGLVIELGALIVVIVLILKEGGFPLAQQWIPIVSLVCLFLSWMPFTHRYLLEGTLCRKILSLVCWFLSKTPCINRCLLEGTLCRKIKQAAQVCFISFTCYFL